MCLEASDPLDCEVLDRGISGLGLWLMSSALQCVFEVVTISIICLLATACTGIRV